MLRHGVCISRKEGGRGGRRRREREKGKYQLRLFPLEKVSWEPPHPATSTYISLARIESHGYCKGIWEGILNWAYCCLEQNHSSVGKKEGGLWKLESLPKQCLSTHPGMMLAYTSEFLPTVFSVL